MAINYRIPTDGNIIELLRIYKPKGGGADVYEFRYIKSRMRLGKKLDMPVYQLEQSIKRGIFVPHKTLIISGTRDWLKKSEEKTKKRYTGLKIVYIFALHPR